MIHYIQLPFINDTIDVTLMDRLTEWMTLIKDIHLPERAETIKEIISKERVMQMAYEEYSKISEDELMREQLEARQKFILDMNTKKKHAVEKGHAEGHSVGLAEGLAVGKFKEKHEIALAMLTNSYSPTEIAKITGLTIDQIKSIQ